MTRAFQFVSVFLFLFLTSNLHLHAAPLKDPFYSQGQEIQNPPAVYSVQESVDPFSGNLKMVHTDVHLPGNGGLNLDIIRTYDSAVWGKRDVPWVFVGDKARSPLGIGWSIHMGIVRNPNGNGYDALYQTTNPVVEMPDGSQHMLYHAAGQPSNVYISKDYWLYKIVSTSKFELTLTDGTIYTFENNPTTAGYSAYDGTIIAQVTKIENAAKNSSINITYNKSSGTGVGLGYSYISTIIDSANRTITFDYDFTKHQLRAIYLGSIGSRKLISYQYDNPRSCPSSTGTCIFMNKATLPEGSATTNTGNWTYLYNSSNHQMEKITYPGGGTIDYVYGDKPFRVNTTQTVNFSVVTQRTTKTNDTPNVTDTWTYQYETGLTSIGNRTTITTLGGLKEVYIFDSWSTTGYESQTSNKVWKVGLPKSIQISINNSVIYSETTTWTKSLASISGDDISSASWGSGGAVADSEIYVPYLESKIVVRDGKTYTTTYNDYDSYGNPESIVESGDKTRNTIITYWINTTSINLNMVKNKPSTVTVSGDFPGRRTTNNFPISYVYYQGETGGNIGDLKEINQYGVVTKYEYYTTDGNLKTITDANLNKIAFLWSNGRIKEKQTPIANYIVKRVINTDGTIASETDGRGVGYTTSYDYDDNFRLIKITPPIGDPVNYQYQADNSYKREFRSTSSTYSSGYYLDYNYDGFGRPIGTDDSRGITTSIVYKVYGVKDYTDSNVGDKDSYDYFGRVKEVLHKDGKKITTEYINSDERVTDEELYQTYYIYNAFGNPDEKLLRNVCDAKQTQIACDSTHYTTSYDYNILGSLTKITQPSSEINSPGIVRSFIYDDKNFLQSETHPEKGTIGYIRYNVGTIRYKDDAMGRTEYTYDPLNRLDTVIKSPDINIDYDYDNADNLTGVTNPSATITYTYDKANRLEYKYETISGRQYTTRYQYTAYDDIETITYPSGRSVFYGHNTNYQVNQVKANGSFLVYDVDYYDSTDTGNYFGLPKTYRYQNGHDVGFTYNARNLLRRYTGGVAGSPKVDLEYQYYDRGNTWTITNYVDRSKDQSFSYDELNRLRTFNGVWGSGSYTYYPSGNRWTKSINGSTSTYGYDAMKNRLLTITGAQATSYGYNNDGNMTSIGLNYIMDYDGAHNMTAFKSGASPLASFTYDGKGMRVTKSSNGKSVVYHYDQNGLVLSENDENNNLIADYVYLHGKLVAKIAPIPVAPTNLKAWPAYTSQNNLKWDDNTDEHGYTLERKAGSGSYSVIATNAANQTTYSDTGLTPGVTYSYRISAYNQAGTSPASIEASAIPVSNPVPAITVTPASWDYGTVIVGTPAVTKTFTLRNSGTSDLRLYVVNYFGTYGPNNPAYSKSADTCSAATLRPQDECSFAFMFSPQVTGTGQGNINISSVQLATVNVPVTGYGQKQYNLTVLNAGTGTGTVSRSLTGTSCGTGCQTYNENTEVTLTATPGTCSLMASWAGGNCSGSEPCKVTMTANTSVTATFNTAPPTADFSATPKTGIETVTTIFSDLSTCNPTSWSWNFGDGTTSTSRTPPSKTYTNLSGGTYTVSLIVSNAVGTTTKVDYITVQACPNLPARIKDTSLSYLKLQDAYTAAPDGATIQTRIYNFTGENLAINKNITLEGGYDCNYSYPPTGSTTLTGSITTNAGTTTIKDFILQK